MGIRSWVAVATGCLVAPALPAPATPGSALPVDGGPSAARAFPGEVRRIACVTDRDGNDEIWTMAADGSGQRRLTDEGVASDREAFWGPAAEVTAVPVDGELLVVPRSLTPPNFHGRG